MRRVFCLFFILLALCLSLPQPSQAQERMRIAWAGSTPSNTPIWVADQKGFFKKNGLNAEVIAISASTIVIQALLTGEVDFIIAPSATLVTSRLAGADTVMVSTNLPLFIDHIVSLGNITTVEQLKGKIGGVNRLGTTSDMTLRLALRRLGVDPGEGDQDHRHRRKPAATGRSGATISRSSRSSANRWCEKPRSSAFAICIDIGTLKIPYHVNAVVTREKTVKERRPFVAKVVRAFTEALHFIKTNKEETKALIGKNLKTNDPEGLERAYRAYNGAFPEVPYPNAEGVKTLLDDIAPRTPKAATADPKSFVDMSLVQELEASGFIKQLYKR